MKIGIFGGSFNPPHKMHKYIATTLLELGILDKIIFVPASDGYNKNDLISNKDRFNMIGLMINGTHNLEASNYECDKESYTYQTLDYFKNIYFNDEIYFICGMDNLNEFDTWENYDYILSNYKLIIINRDNKKIDFKYYEQFKDNIIITNFDTLNMSSTIIRKNLRENKDVSFYLDQNVINYIEKNNLYN